MIHSIQIPQQTFERLQAHAVPFVDTPVDVIERFLDHMETCNNQPNPDNHAVAPSKRMASLAVSSDVTRRAPRERGVRIELDGQTISARTVRDLYSQSLRRLVRSVGRERLDALVPFATSSERYLIARAPVHPTGKAFFNEVEEHGLFMEAHKDYRNAVSHLQQFARKCGVRFRYLGA